MTSPQRDVAADTKERHTDTLPTPDARAVFVEQFTKASLDAVHALTDVMEALCQSPEQMLRQAFVPTIIGMHPEATAILEITHLDGLKTPGKSAVAVKARIPIEGSGEVGFRVVWQENAIIPTQDDRIG